MKLSSKVNGYGLIYQTSKRLPYTLKDYAEKGRGDPRFDPLLEMDNQI